MVAKWGGMVILAIYALFSLPLSLFEDLMDKVRDVVARIFPGPMLVLGKYNAKGYPKDGCEGRDGRRMGSGTGSSAVQ